MATSKQKVLIYRLGSLGDTVIVLPVFHKIREAYPDAEITLLTNKPIVNKAAPLESILGSSGYFFDRVLSYPIGTRDPEVLMSLLKEIRALKIDVLIYLAGVRTLKTIFKTKITVFRDWCFFKAAGVKKTVGFPKIRQDYELSVDAETGEFEWEAKRLARRVKALGPIPLSDDNYWNFKFCDLELETANTMLKPISGQPIFAASIGTKSQACDWEEDNWLNLLKRLTPALPGFQLVMVGGPDEFERSERCIAAWGGAGINLCGKTSPRVSALILKQARTFLGHDSGPMHLAAAVGTACTAVFSARALPRQWYPRGDYHKIIFHQTDCAGCALETCIVEKKKCILSITVNEVESAVLELLGKGTKNKYKL